MGTVNLRVVADNTQKEFDEKNKWVVTRYDIFGGRAEIHQTVTSELLKHCDTTHLRS